MTVQGATLFDIPEPQHTDDVTRCSVRSVTYQTAASLIEPNHYLHSMGSTVAAYGSYLDGWLVGAMTFGTIPGPNARGICGPEWAGHVWELTRLYCTEWMGKNAESRFIGRVFRMLRPVALERGGLILISYADTSAGHVGTIYQATNWIYVGESTSTKVVGDDGELIHSRVASDARRGVSSAGRQHVKQPPKHRYIKFIGSKSQIRSMASSLKWETLPYPKPAAEVSTGETPDDLSGGVGSIPTCRSIASEAT